VHPEQLPGGGIASRLKPIVESHGSWIMVSLGDSCTLVEYFNATDPGGALGATQALVINGSIRSTLNAVVRLAGPHLDRPHDGEPFLRPDGTPCD
jgi:hypothetical protein